MLRSILIRQTFVWVDLTLAVLVAATAAMVIYGLITPATVEGNTALAGIVGEPTLPTPVPMVQARDSYDALVTSGLFKAAEAPPPPPPPPPPPVDENVEETQLNLRLIGTTDTDDVRFATAIIQEGDQAGTGGVYAINENIMDNVVLKEVLHREVIIENSTSGAPKLERLSMDDVEEAKAPGPEPAPAAPPEQPTGGVQRITLNRDELMQDIYANYADIATKVKPELARDESGNVIGVTANNISAVPLARKLGLGDGDVLQTVNNESIDSEQKIYEMIQKYQNASSIRIGVMSGGKPKVITYRLN